MKIKVVIGANYGDEGKGLMTDYLVRNSDKPIVIRFNGGAQAGHTVSVDDPKIRHVFSHFGAGTLAGAPTYLSQFFVVNPLIYEKEKKQLESIMGDRNIPKLIINPECEVTTPFDILLNQNIENYRAKSRIGRHGSVGVGFGETLERAEKYSTEGNPFRFKHLISMKPGEIHDLLVRIKNEWFYKRMSELPHEFQLHDECFYESIIDQFVEACSSMRDETFFSEAILCEDIFTPVFFSYNDVQTLIFEGAQGLMLDQNRPEFPHVTRSNTGMMNVMEILNDAMKNVLDGDLIEEAEIVYVTRAYVTRHGVGPLSREVEHPRDIGFDVHDQTNVKGEFQGSLRFAPLDMEDVISRCYKDARLYDKHGIFKLKFAVTCVDQLMEPDHKKSRFSHRNQHQGLMQWIVEFASYISFGPTHKDVAESRIVRKILRCSSLLK